MCCQNQILDFADVSTIVQIIARIIQGHSPIGILGNEVIHLIYLQKWIVLGCNQIEWSSLEAQHFEKQTYMYIEFLWLFPVMCSRVSAGFRPWKWLLNTGKLPREITSYLHWSWDLRHTNYAQLTNETEIVLFHNKSNHKQGLVWIHAIIIINILLYLYVCNLWTVMLKKLQSSELWKHINVFCIKNCIYLNRTSSVKGFLKHQVNCCPWLQSYSSISLKTTWS